MKPALAADQRLWFDPGFGAAGDMILGSLLGLGVDAEQVTSLLQTFGVGVAVRSETVTRNSLSSTRALVEIPTDPVHHRSWTAIDRMITESALPSSVVAGARGTFRRLGEVEAAIHHQPIDEVHFHEVGALDAIADIVGAWIGWHLLGEPKVSVGPFGLGHGTVRAAHGELPLPAPAVATMLTGWPTRPVEVAMETVTPSAAAILTTMGTAQRNGPPSGVLTAAARGAGGRDPQTHPNVVTALLLTPDETPESAGTETLLELHTNVDDVTGEVLAFAIQRCLEAGAADAWTTPISMKKGRPAHTFTVLCTPPLAVDMRRVMMEETGSLGVRQRAVQRFAADRTVTTVEVRGHRIRVKVGPNGAKPEFDDCAAAARALQLPLRQIQTEALDAV